jgi:hypothetical protein
MVTRYEEVFKKSIVEIVKEVRQLIRFEIGLRSTPSYTLMASQFQLMSSKNFANNSQY